jgi:hypothetical protein
MLRTDAANNSYDQARASRDEALLIQPLRDKVESSRGMDKRRLDQESKGGELLVYNFSMSSRVAVSDYGKPGKEG